MTETEYTNSVNTCQEESTSFVAKEEEKNPVHVEMGSKLWKFQQELNLTQEEFGKKFSTKRNDQFARSFSKRMIQGYESGENELSGELLFNIWKAGFSINALFAETAQPLNIDPDSITGTLRDAISQRQSNERTSTPAQGAKGGSAPTGDARNTGDIKKSKLKKRKR